MVFVRLITSLLRDKKIGKNIVPIVPDEARTFGMDGLFRQFGIYSREGQKYQPEDADKVMWYRESEDGVMLEEGINEAGAFSAWIALATSYANNSLPMIPFYIYYSMFGFQRVHDLAWAAGDARARGFFLVQHQEEQLLMVKVCSIKMDIVTSWLKQFQTANLMTPALIMN